MGYYKSSTVSVFPTTGRTLIPDGKFTSESNFVNIVNCLTDNFKVTSGGDKVLNDGYLLSHTTINNTSTVKVIIHGYYFELTAVTLSSSNPLWLGICVRNADGRLVSYSKSTVLDSGVDLTSSNFEGLFTFTDKDAEPPGSGSNDYTYYWLKIHRGSVDPDDGWVNCTRIDGNAINYSYNTSSGASVSMTERVDTLNSIKQNNLDLTASSGLEFEGSSDVKLKLQGKHLTHLDTIETKTLGVITRDGVSNPVLMKFVNGIPDNINNISVGTAFNSNSEVVGHAQNVYVENGVVKAGQTIYISADRPVSGTGKVGDLWFRYTDN